ncbi:MAG TPA: class I SAM-dependent methyltransferase [Blastocatellia bacterium]|nr:class I SAM-dependent methyltransferase [Blastocatellia bacterium]
MYLVSILKPKMIVELGTHFGESYGAFCQAVKELSLDAHCYAIDTWEGDAHSGYYGPEVLAELRAHNALFYESFSRLIQSTFDQALDHFNDATIDLLHIDGYHVYEAVRHDFEAWLPKMSSQGVMLLHDINVREGDFGVRRLWDEIKSKYRHFEFIHGHGLGILALGEINSPEFEELVEATDEQIATIRDFFFQLGNRLDLTIANENKANTLKLQADQLSELNQMINALREDRERYKQLVAELEQKIQNLSLQGSERERRFQIVLSQLADKDRAIGLASRHLERQQQAIQYLSAKLEDNEESVRALLRQVSEKESLASSLSLRLANGESQNEQVKRAGLRRSLVRWIGRR